MYKTKSRSRHSDSDFDIYGDLANIKAALAATTRDVKGKAGEVLSQSLDNLIEKSTTAQENVAEYVTEKPFKSIGMAAIAGLIVGYLLNR